MARLSNTTLVAQEIFLSITISSLCAVIYIKEGCSKMSKIIGARRPYCSPRTTIAALPATCMHMGKRYTRVHVRVKLAGERLSTSIIHPQRSNLFFFLTRKLKVPVTDRGGNGAMLFFTMPVFHGMKQSRERAGCTAYCIVHVQPMTRYGTSIVFIKYQMQKEARVLRLPLASSSQADPITDPLKTDPVLPGGD